MIVREYCPGDSDRIYGIICSSLDETYKQELLSYLYLQWPKGQLVACDFSGRPVGFLSASRIDAAHARIMLLAVDGDRRSVGIGSKLFTHFRHIALMNGMNHISLEVRPSNMRAVNFYRRHGFVATEVLRNYYNDGGDAVRLNLTLQLNI
ncbi:MAG: GNAT family N-acetyltransferase [Methanomassiliicoccaceae archaeon]|jgi:ribosomal-protein-alanine N-acetyltransferase|nr:GNAT family N-acetyltransferase [Methanomassiliicoccaceae archaeon]